MTKIALLVVAVLLTGCPKSSPSSAGGGPDSAPASASAPAPGEAVIRAYIQIDPARVTREKLAALGVQVDTVAGDIMTARIPEGALDRVRATDGVRHVEIARPVHLLSDAGAMDPLRDAGKRD